MGMTWEGRGGEGVFLLKMKTKIARKGEIKQKNAGPVPTPTLLHEPC
jgi:hypothetical protein